MSKQAVLLIHGIGEQRPMETLRRFVDAVWRTDKASQKIHSDGGMVWSKPYKLSRNYELRRLTTAENKAGIRTDFFEFYWAHLMQGTKVGHVISWAKTLLFRSPDNVPKQLRLAYWVLWCLILFGVVMALRSTLVESEDATTLGKTTSWIMSLAVIPAILGVLVNVVGDAARYLHVHPTNVDCRQRIRDSGIEILESLHKRGYQRIIVVGHSLGSVIGYDILTHAWPSFNTRMPKDSSSYAALDELEALTERVESCEEVPIHDIRAAQRRYFNELNDNAVGWRVSDFITLGSPLAHAEILLAQDADQLWEKIQDREFPGCPPILEESQKSGQTLKRFSYEIEGGVRFPHHAAVFGPTRWTNFFFPNKALIWGDLIGGPLKALFGHGVSDRPVTTSQRFGILSHTLYWSPEPGSETSQTAGGEQKKAADAHIYELRNALDLIDRNG